MRKWEELPDFMRTEAVRPYYDILSNKKGTLAAKRAFDLVMASFLLIFLSPVMLVIAVAVKLDSKGEIFFRQERVTQYGKIFKIYKFRTMVKDADKLGSQVTTKNDARVTRIGRFLRKYRLDETAQLFNVITGDMSFVGTRPEAVPYAQKYTKEMMATLLLPAGITSEASIRYKDEDILLDVADDIDKIYVEDVLPEKMKYNYQSLRNFSFIKDILTMLKTILVVLGKTY
ncbi:sugar transferase [uncultured Cloacibacillus sp.]|uniref:sugar transferase n=1 Tax=uncultured Cloacibacillus sp. TaxID=889794 RepID=UPI00345B867C